MPAVLRKLGRYEIVREVGRGGMAVVYLARQSDLNRVVALKELSAFHAADPAFAERFVRESHIAGSLSHPNIVTVHDFFEHDGTPYIAMEYIEGGSLRPFVGRLTLAQVAGVLECVLAGLTHAESRGIVHRDLKPENVMVTAEGAVKIADFGIAKALNQAGTARVLTGTGAMGTPAYMAPEQALGGSIGPWTDLYSSGVLAYELLLGRLPFDDADTPMAVLLQHIRDPIPTPRSIDPGIDDRVESWLERMLEKAPERRPGSAAQAWDELEEVVIATLGPRWRREARLIERPSLNGRPEPLTPAAFDPPGPRGIATRPADGVFPPERAEEPLGRPQPPTVPARPLVATPPTVARKRLPRRRRSAVIGSLLAAVATAGVAIAILPGRLDESKADQTTPRTAATAGRKTGPGRTTITPPASPALAEQVAIRRQGLKVTAAITFSGPALDPGGLVFSDKAVGDGKASFLLWQRGVASRIGRRSSNGVTLRITGKPSRLAFELSSEPGAFTAVSAPRIIRDHTLEISLVQAPPAQNTTPATTTPATPPPPPTHSTPAATTNEPTPTIG